jgi:hypothetical protein
MRIPALGAGALLAIVGMSTIAACGEGSGTPAPTPRDAAVDASDASASDGGVTPAAPTLLAAGVDTPLGLAADEATAFWTASGTQPGTGSLQSVRIEGGSPTTLLARQQSPFGLALGPNTLFFTTAGDGAVWSLGIGSTAPVQVATAQPTVNEIRIAPNGDLYWANAGSRGTPTGSIARVDASGAISMIATAQGFPYDLAVDAEGVYWANLEEGTIMRAPLAGGPARVLAANEDLPLGLAVDAATIYWGTRLAGLRRAAKVGGGTATTIAPSRLPVNAVAIDGSTLFWTSGRLRRDGVADGVVMRMELPDGTTSVVATGQDDPRSLALTSRYVLWTNAGSTSNSGSVMRAPR